MGMVRRLPAAATKVMSAVSSTDGFTNCKAVFGIDFDGDGDADVVASAAGADAVAWFENDGSEGFAERAVAGDAGGALGAFAADMDGDATVDVLAAAATEPPGRSRRLRVVCSDPCRAHMITPILFKIVS